MEPMGTTPEGNRRHLGQRLLFVVEKLSKRSNLKKSLLPPCTGGSQWMEWGDLFREALVALGRGSHWLLPGSP